MPNHDDIDAPATPAEVLALRIRAANLETLVRMYRAEVAALKSRKRAKPAPVAGADPLGKPYLTAAELAEVLSLSVETLDKWRREKRGPLPTYSGRAVRYSRANVLAYLESQTGLSSTERRIASQIKAPSDWDKNGTRKRRR